jgi:hypothetical protein
MWSFEGNLEKYCGFLLVMSFTPQAASVFQAGSSMVGLGSQRVKQLFPNEKTGIKLTNSDSSE